MLRVRFHGRGGHGVKTASRILGTGAFLMGLEIQDSPIYGAERRGAAIAAFTRIDSQPIRERGIVVDPDLIVVTDETLLTDPAAGILVGVNHASAVFVNSPRPGNTLANQFEINCPVWALDVTALTMQKLGRGYALSAALGAAGCAMTGLISSAKMAQAVSTELTDLGLARDLIDQNIELAQEVFGKIPAIPIRERREKEAPAILHAPKVLDSAEGMPILYAQGNSPARHTGSWRIFRPVIDHDACTRCGICFALCPDGAITLDSRGYPVIDYDNCKGCMICRQECPIHCIEEQKEVRAW